MIVAAETEAVAQAAALLVTLSRHHLDRARAHWMGRTCSSASWDCLGNSRFPFVPRAAAAATSTKEDGNAIELPTSSRRRRRPLEVAAGSLGCTIYDRQHARTDRQRRPLLFLSLLLGSSFVQAGLVQAPMADLCCHHHHEHKTGSLYI